MVSKARKRLYQFMRYHHFNSYPALKSHSRFISVLGVIEEHAQKQLCSDGTLEESWKEILSNIKTMTNEEIEDAIERIESNQK